jgi:hypothetical protein
MSCTISAALQEMKDLVIQPPANVVLEILPWPEVSFRACKIKLGAAYCDDCCGMRCSSSETDKSVLATVTRASPGVVAAI